MTNNVDPINLDIPIMTVSTDFQDHNWVQHGNELHCGGGCSLIGTSNVNGHGTSIKGGLMLVGSRGSWDLVPEGGTPRKKKGLAP